MTSSSPERLLNDAEAAAHLGISIAELVAYRSTVGEADFVKLGPTIRYIENDLDWCLEQSDQATGYSKVMGSTRVGFSWLSERTLLIVRSTG